ncbi:MAG: methylated-DNA--[protein]-cysteine S-methyltransferase [Candidatus Thorarchaeota archaeon]|nr:methylated-DNA--[protein]-cysteine S-methyltransferase [Candidatus Thorarchaeota archaeon]
MYYAIIETTFGHIGLVHEGTKQAGVERIILPSSKSQVVKHILSLFPKAVPRQPQIIEPLTDLLVDYFEGKPVKFPLDFLNLTICYPFQIKVIKAEWSIPYGKVATYSWIAKKIGSNAYRAVGNALARNPFPIIIPCHRAIRSDMALGGFQGGLQMKQKLLELEGVQFDAEGHVLRDYIIH